MKTTSQTNDVTAQEKRRRETTETAITGRLDRHPRLRRQWIEGTTLIKKKTEAQRQK